jgi:predicted nucleic acid-binding protein
MTEPKVAILDTTFVLPLFGIDVELAPGFKQALRSTWKHGIDGYKLVLPTVCLLEVGYKLNKEYRERGDKQILDRYPTVLPTVTRSNVVRMHDPHLDPVASSAAMEIRAAGHPDLLDCWIAGSAIALEGTLVTEDDTLKDVIRSIPAFAKVVILSWGGFQAVINAHPPTGR